MGETPRVWGHCYVPFALGIPTQARRKSKPVYAYISSPGQPFLGRLALALGLLPRYSLGGGAVFSQILLPPLGQPDEPSN